MTKNCLIIGIKSSLGIEIAKLFKNNNYEVFGTSRNFDKKTNQIISIEQNTLLSSICINSSIKVSLGIILYLASDLSKYATGHQFFVEGGWTAI